MRAFAQKPLQPPRATSSPFSTGTPFTSFTLQQTSRSRPRIQSQQFRSAFTQRPPARRNLSFFRRSSTNATPPPSLSERLKKLSREYGWSALGVYFALSALDFPFCFLAVRLVGTERIGQFEHAIVSQVKRWIPYGSTGEQVEEAAAEAHEAAVQLFDHGVEAAETANMGEEASAYSLPRDSFTLFNWLT